MMQQYFEVKRGLPRDTLLLFRLGDFFELFFDDAVTASKLLGLTLTKRQDHPMAGIPAHACDNYVSKLLAAGKKVAICDQAEPAKAGKLVRRQLTRIDSNGRHLLTIINEILDITRIEAGKMPMQISEFNLNDLVPEVITELDPVISRSKLTVTSRLSPEPPLMISDRQKVKQVIVNLLSNALKFTHQGGIEIGVEYDPRTRMSSIAVRDTGIGIAPEHHDKIFEDFRQVDDSPSRQYGGTGLGLAICRRLASALGGRITLQSNLGEGSTFTLTIPAEAPQ